MSDSKVKFLFGTESGNSQKMATIAQLSASALGCDTELIDMNEFDPADLSKWETLVMVISTNGDGDMPMNAEAAWDEAKKLQLKNLSGLRYAILALGDTSYDYYCQAGLDWDEYLSEAGAKAFVVRRDVDVDFYEPSLGWITQLLMTLTKKSDDEVKKAIDDVVAGNTGGDLDNEDDGYSHKRPWAAEIIEKRDLCAKDSSKSVKHYSLNLKGSDIHYQAGDCMEVLPVNDKQQVQTLIDVMSWKGDEKVVVDGETMDICKALETKLEIRQPTLKLLKLISARTNSRDFSMTVMRGSKTDIEELTYGHDVASIVDQYALPAIPHQDWKSKILNMLGKKHVYARIDADILVKYLKPLQARAYSIASSQTVHPDEVHLTIADVVYEKNGRHHEGAASMHLAKHLNKGDKISCWLLPNKYFTLPENDATPILMIGPGTGIAPFIGFLQERAHKKAVGKNWLLFGDRTSKNDFLYEKELRAFEQTGVLSKLDTAFSRDQKEKVYVQHLLSQQAAEVFKWMELGAVIYVCGDAKRMAKDVEETLIRIIQEQGKHSLEDAKAYLKAMRKDQRYLKDVY